MGDSGSDSGDYQRKKMPNSEKQASTNDRACGRCRDRKIRCGRERPRCTNCTRDKVECGYSTPEKRVNHIKLLCNNVGDLEGRLGSIEGELSNLAMLLKSSSSQRSSMERAEEEDSPLVFMDDDHFMDNGTTPPPTDRHIIRSPGDLTDRYHGPATIFALCSQFSDTVLHDQSQEGENSQYFQDRSQTMEALKDTLTRMCLEASLEEPFDIINTSSASIRLPPKQFLLMVQAQFFQHADYATDLFVQKHFCAVVEEIYSRPFNASDEPWAITFNTIILLVLGSEMSTQSSDPLIRSQFAMPFLTTVRTALSNPSLLMAPRLINCQTLALLSIAAQRYYPPGYSESIFAQACVLSRTIGLHQLRTASDGVDPDETQERFKVFMSLYLRDKSFSISRGSICWLPSFDCNLAPESPELGFTDPKCATRLQLARLQEEIYRLSHSAESRRQSNTRRKNSIYRLEQTMERWACENELFNAPWKDRTVFDLQLEFLSARITAFSRSSDPVMIGRSLNDARAACLFLLVSFGKHDQNTIQKLESLQLTKSPSKSLGKTAGNRSSRHKHVHKTSIHNKGDATSPAHLCLHDLPDAFPVSAFFLLAKNVLRTPTLNDELREDINLLVSVSTIYQELDTKTQAANQTRKVGRAFTRLLEVINILLKEPHTFQQTPPPLYQSFAQSPVSGREMFTEPQDLADFSTLMLNSAYSTPPLSKTTSATGTSANISPGTITPAVTDFYFDPFQQLGAPPPSKKRPRLTEQEAYMDDYSDPRLFTDYLSTSPTISF